MKKLIFSALATVFTFYSAVGQIYKTNTGNITFNSKASETITGTNNAVNAAIDTKTGKVEFSMAINSFQFTKDLMKKHFQETYMESVKFPTSTFKGSIADNSKVNYSKDGTYEVTVKGKLTIHGVTKDISTPGKIIVKGGKVTLSTSSLKVKPADYSIKIPADKVSSIAKEIDIVVNCVCSKK